MSRLPVATGKRVLSSSNRSSENAQDFVPAQVSANHHLHLLVHWLNQFISVLLLCFSLTYSPCKVSLLAYHNLHSGVYLDNEVN